MRAHVLMERRLVRRAKRRLALRAAVKKIGIWAVPIATMLLAGAAIYAAVNNMERWMLWDLALMGPLYLYNLFYITRY